jgi:NADPH-dependent glutamate synthase beta subunit-like oxidoreductase/CO/xanthine dehydrogenase FAD-binding subunit
MTIKPVKYIPAENLKSAAALLKQNQGSAVLAGGTDLLGTLKDEIHAEPPQTLIGLKSIKESSYIKNDADGLRIGALTTLAEIARHPVIQKQYPLLAQSAASVASPQIRNVATLAGNLCQEPRCWYYRNPDNNFDCLRKGGRWCDALFAENRYHSIFGAMCVSAAPCENGCPIHNGIPAYMEQIRAGNMEEAVKILLETNPLASITGRVCSRYCEEECNRSDFDESVSIRDVERYLGDASLEDIAKFYPKPSKESGSSAAVVGAGPAGLAAAYFLRKAGHAVTVFDQMPEAGGMLRYSIPEYRLPKKVLTAQVKAFESMGIKFEYNAKIGAPGLTLQDLRGRFQSVFLATGLWKGRLLKLENGEFLESGLEFLIDVQTTGNQKLGKKVLVIGGGSVAVDVALTAHRLGAEKVTMACLESLETMPAVGEDVVQAQEEGIQIMASWGPKQVLVENSKLAGLELVRCTSVVNKEGRFSPEFDEKETIKVEADQILVAIGQAADLDFVNSLLAVERGMIQTEENATATSLDGVYAGGDVTGDSVTVVQAMASGKKAALEITSRLSDTTITAKTASGTEKRNINPAALGSSAPVKESELTVAERELNKEDKLVLTTSQVEAEAKRCANCGCVAVNASDVATALVALDARVKTTQRELEIESLFAAAKDSTTVLAEDELIEEIHIPALAADTKQSYLKFRVRNSIDFPILGVAFKALVKGKTLSQVRVVFGAAAPLPYRARKVETLLEGKVLDEKIIAEAMNTAVEGAQPLARNRAKVEILKALVAKTLRGISETN